MENIFGTQVNSMVHWHILQTGRIIKLLHRPFMIRLYVYGNIDYSFIIYVKYRLKWIHKYSNQLIHDPRP